MSGSCYFDLLRMFAKAVNVFKITEVTATNSSKVIPVTTTHYGAVPDARV